VNKENFKMTCFYTVREDAGAGAGHRAFLRETTNIPTKAILSWLSLRDAAAVRLGGHQL
jgi:hypothetical protein